MAGDRILRVENSRMMSQLISWKAFDDENFGIQWQWTLQMSKFSLFYPLML